MSIEKNFLLEILEISSIYKGRVELEKVTSRILDHDCVVAGLQPQFALMDSEGRYFWQYHWYG